MFGNHEPASITERGQSPVAIFTRGLQAPGTQWLFRFANGRGASVINDGYGGQFGLFELAVLTRDGSLDYSTPLTNDVLGNLTAEKVTHALDEVAALPAEVTA